MKPKLLSTDQSRCRTFTFAHLQQLFNQKTLCRCVSMGANGELFFFPLRSKMQSTIGGWPNPNPSEGYWIFKREACMWAQSKLVKYINVLPHLQQKPGIANMLLVLCGQCRNAYNIYCFCFQTTEADIIIGDNPNLTLSAAERQNWFFFFLMCHLEQWVYDDSKSINYILW